MKKKKKKEGTHHVLSNQNPVPGREEDTGLCFCAGLGVGLGLVGCFGDECCVWTRTPSASSSGGVDGFVGGVGGFGVEGVGVGFGFGGGEGVEVRWFVVGRGEGVEVEGVGGGEGGF